MADLLHGRGGGGALLIANMVEPVAGSRWAGVLIRARAASKLVRADGGWAVSAVCLDTYLLALS